MRPFFLFALVAVMLLSACASVPKESKPMPQRRVTPDAPELPSCCADYETIRRLAGKRVSLRGRYEKVAFSKRPGWKAPPPDLSKPGSVRVLHASGTSIMLGVYHQKSGVHLPDELRRYHGKEVVVVGTLHEHTPAIMVETPQGPMPAQTMTSPYIEVESISLIRE